MKKKIFEITLMLAVLLGGISCGNDSSDSQQQ